MSNIAEIVNLFFTVMTIAIFARAIFSWIDPGMNSPVGKLLYDITEPVIGPIRRVVPSAGMFDFSPIIALILLQVLGRLITSALAS